MFFYDVRAQKYLESSINSNRIVVLKASKGYVVCFKIPFFFLIKSVVNYSKMFKNLFKNFFLFIYMYMIELILILIIIFFYNNISFLMKNT